MSEGQDKQDKTHDATPHRLRKAREEGNVFRSQESTTVGMLAAGVSVLVVGTPFAFTALQNLMAYAFTGATTFPLTQSTLPTLLADFGSRLALILGPLFGTLLVAALGLNILQTGWNVTTKPLVPKGNRINPQQGLKRIFSARGLFTLGKSLLKIAIVGPMAYLTITGHLAEILVLHTWPLHEILGAATSWIIVLLTQIIIVLLVLSGIDFAFEKWRYKNDLKMSMKELKDESKELEGNPQVKSRRREQARALARRPRLDHAVLQADVVVTNPTHYAVALRYDPGEADAPRVLVKGIRKRALRIKDLARTHDIPTVENRPLARALYAGAEEMQAIPEELYPAVAALLAEIYRHQGRM